ncbi:stage II sporulation protein GA (sporulation sigma-E factor processing peptidase) [Gracilibacillus ureilyticus]|uniref:Sporulation sigma-E factor-processing peptidase n=1 Tax=Gracilibacillus ureilyticus TaxID=531814 RepID=A0A1H9KZE4_9BACI|nr:sigma-E processing peptidase SpoIIGA [Gracilibacillus ureilyticus]SER04153.1 stage II sporulation protein GA (sporulation sigma-E factor processing peptidase) [Gracilibacillus ureilyticus]
MTVYIELIWLINWGIDWMILLLTQSILYSRTKWYRICLAGFIGSVIVPVSLLIPASFLETWYIKVIHSFFIIFIAFGFTNTALFIKHLFTFYFMTFAIGGGLLAIHYMADSNQLTSYYSQLQPTQIHGFFVLIGFPFVYFFTKQRMDKHKYNQLKKDFMYLVTISWRNKEVEVSGYVDSGNQLVDPISKKPVIICDETFLKECFTEQEFHELKGLYESVSHSEIPSVANPVYRLVPFQGVGGNVEWLIAFSPDNLKIHIDSKQQIETQQVLIGIRFGQLVGDQSYHCLLHPKLFQEVG